MKFLTVAVLLLCTIDVKATLLSDKAIQYVPNGKVVKEKGNELKIITVQETFIEIEFHNDGSFEEASGNYIEKDTFVPEKDFLSLEKIRESLKKLGKKAQGEWSFEKSFFHGWYYEVDGIEDNKKIEYIIDAKTGKILDEKIDN